MRAHFTVSVVSEEKGFSVEVAERVGEHRARTTLAARESATSTPEEVGDVARELIVELLHPIPPPERAVSQR